MMKREEGEGGERGRGSRKKIRLNTIVVVTTNEMFKVYFPFIQTRQTQIYHTVETFESSD